MKNLKFLAVAAMMLGFFGGNAQAALVDLTFTPADCNLGVNCWTSNDTANPSPDDIEALVGTSTDLTGLYKDNVGGGEEGPFAGSYETTYFNTPLDPEDALIELIPGNNPITCGECYLVIKDGNSTPALYVFDLSLVGMIDTITLTDFWPGSGSISHVEIMGDVAVIPVPAAVWLFGTALLGFIGISRRTRV